MAVAVAAAGTPFYLLYWYKSTNTDTKGGRPHAPPPRLGRSWGGGGGGSRGGGGGVGYLAEKGGGGRFKKHNLKANG